MKKALIAAIPLALLAACAIAPPQYAHRDYEQYPSYKKEIALHNIARIFDSECSRVNFFTGSHIPIYEVNAGHLYCEQRTCESYGEVSTGNWRTSIVCNSMESTSFDIPWLDVIEPRLVDCTGGKCVNFSVSSRLFDFKARNARQAEELVEAIRIYKTN